jgi:hypothetical protein
MECSVPIVCKVVDREKTWSFVQQQRTPLTIGNVKAHWGLMQVKTSLTLSFPRRTGQEAFCHTRTDAGSLALPLCSRRRASVTL